MHTDKNRFWQIRIVHIDKKKSKFSEKIGNKFGKKQFSIEELRGLHIISIVN